MLTRAIKTRLLQPPRDDFFSAIKARLQRIPERSIVVVASKAVSIHEGRCIPVADVPDKDALVYSEADKHLPRSKTPHGYAVLTIKDRILIPSAGIDESNAGAYYILWPKKPMRSAKELWQFLRTEYQVKNFGVIIADSHTVPMRRGTMGIAIGYYGLHPINDYRGTGDLFGRKLKVSTVDVVDSLAATAVLAMGEGSEQQPLALITGVPFATFSARPYQPKGRRSSLHIGWNEDLYGPLLRAVTWKK
ncbi:MAG: coenzyme F420-0:L-glutamate ligase [Patescibacteria group bacterium]